MNGTKCYVIDLKQRRGIHSAKFLIGHLHFCLRRSRRKHLFRNNDTRFMNVYLYNILFA